MRHYQNISDFSPGISKITEKNLMTNFQKYSIPKNEIGWNTYCNLYNSKLFKLAIICVILIVSLIYLALINKAHAEPTNILGRVTGIQLGCPYGDRFNYGFNCADADTSCNGGKNYTITWKQGARSYTLGNNDCFRPEGFEHFPRFTFENQNEINK